MMTCSFWFLLIRRDRKIRKRLRQKIRENVNMGLSKKVPSNLIQNTDLKPFFFFIVILRLLSDTFVLYFRCITSMRYPLFFSHDRIQKEIQQIGKREGTGKGKIRNTPKEEDENKSGEKKMQQCHPISLKVRIGNFLKYQLAELHGETKNTILSREIRGAKKCL